MTEYSRVLYLDHPAAVRKNLDELLVHTPPSVLAAPRGYAEMSAASLGGRGLSPKFLLITPSKAEWEDVKKGEGMVLPRWPFETRISEFYNSASSTSEKSTKQTPWNPHRVLSDGYYIFFDGLGYPSTTATEDGATTESRSSIPQPWKQTSLWDDVAPECGKEDCGNRKVWRKIYKEFREKRMEVCGLDLEV
ncbi:hypothetical protein ABW19_dt0204853 [Dactylella cylindrospora]|nr:hypothetical protein ABW19_dt0204853 [Dactylella cylindrospora]